MMNILSIFLQAFLPMRIAHYQRKGGATESDYERLGAIAEKICSQGTALMWRNADGSTKELASDLVEALAIASSPPQDAAPEVIQMAHYREGQIHKFIEELGKV